MYSRVYTSSFLRTIQEAKRKEVDLTSEVKKLINIVYESKESLLKAQVIEVAYAFHPGNKDLIGAKRYKTYACLIDVHIRVLEILLDYMLEIGFVYEHNLNYIIKLGFYDELFDKDYKVELLMDERYLEYKYIIKETSGITRSR